MDLAVQNRLVDTFADRMQIVLYQNHQDMFKQARPINELSTGPRICSPVRFSHTALQIDP